MNTEILIVDAATPAIEVLCAELKWIELLVPVRGIADELMFNERGNEVTFVKYLADPSWKLTATMGRDKP